MNVFRLLLSVTLPAVHHHGARVRRCRGFHSSYESQQSGGVIRHPVLRPGCEVELAHLMLAVALGSLHLVDVLEKVSHSNSGVELPRVSALVCETALHGAHLALLLPLMIDSQSSSMYRMDHKMMGEQRGGVTYGYVKEKGKRTGEPIGRPTAKQPRPVRENVSRSTPLYSKERVSSSITTWYVLDTECGCAP
ncbi:hypothetical protein EYF80_013531 [Liparis tanakae]|uniref:Uncharacterized protein n=1 Tax=Liparis tanakae TaxID=230148 RepID=A0A4Z2IGI0_9TELE|nr:hypothetical protein EYF80_013531 [Liparis tanakae]